MASISADPASRELLQYCLEGRQWPASLLRTSLGEREGRALLQIVVERLADLFEPELTKTYVRLFTEVIEELGDGPNAAALSERYERVRQPRPCTVEPEQIFVLSRVTLGADVAVTSLVINALKARFPAAAIYFVGSKKNYALFEADPRIRLREFDYPRNSALADRLRNPPMIDVSNSIVVDPDSRLTQLGLIAICPESRYFFFESRAYGGTSPETIVTSTTRWLAETFQVYDAVPGIHPLCVPMPGTVAVSLGVGENPEKRLDDRFENDLLGLLSNGSEIVVLDQGAGGEEAERAQRLASRFPNVILRAGSYGPFASMISQARLYVGYDSAGQHVAAAARVPLLSIFKGHASQRMFERWRPHTQVPSVVLKIEQDNQIEALTLVETALKSDALSR